MQHLGQRQLLTPQQIQQQPIDQDNNKYISSEHTALTNGRVPDTSRDGRKLFVGGLRNEVSDQLFLQFFQNYGEVVDSVVLSDRKTKRSRGFGFVTFADPGVAASILNTIPGRTGVVKIMGKDCEVKASEPKPANAPHHARHSKPPYYRPPQGWSNDMPLFGPGGGGTTIPHQLHVDQTLLVPPNFISSPRGRADGGGRGGVSIYSHSTITRSTAGPGGASHDGAATAVYIQNNFYSLPPGGTVPPTYETPEQLQEKQKFFVQNGDVAALGRFSPMLYTVPSSSALQPSYPGPNGSEMDSMFGRQLQFPQQKQQDRTMSPYSTWQY